MFSLRKTILLAVLTLLGTPLVGASLPPGGVIFPTGTTFANDSDQGGTVINDNLCPVTFGGPFWSPPTICKTALCARTISSR